MTKRKTTRIRAEGEALSAEELADEELAAAEPERTALTGEAARAGERVFYTNPDGGRLEATIVTVYDDGTADLVVLTPGVRGATEESQHPHVEQGGEGSPDTWYEREPD